MSRARVVNGGRLAAETEHAMTQAWHQLVDKVRKLPSRPAAGAEEDRRAALAEKAALDEALDQLSVLLELRRSTLAAAAAERDVARSTPGIRDSPAPGGGDVQTPPSLKRKRRLSLGTASPGPREKSPHPPTHGHGHGPHGHLGAGIARGGTPAGGKRARGVGELGDQLPLRAGRKVAVRQKQQAGRKDDEGEEWILASVRKMIGTDKAKYEVQDADDGTRWVTTLKSIILLPDPQSPVAASCHPSNLDDYPRGTQVLALYPDTTSFYKATVVSAPVPGTGMGHGVRGGANGRADPAAKAGQYRLAFVDDGDNIHEVDKDLVVLHPGERI